MHARPVVLRHAGGRRMPGPRALVEGLPPL